MDDHAGDHRWLSYSQLAETRAISRTSAIRLVRKHRWPRRTNNAGVVTVAVPVAFAVSDRKAPGDAPGDGPNDRPGALTVLAAALEALRTELARAHTRADAAETAAKEARAEAQETAQAAEALRQADAARKALDLLGLWLNAAGAVLLVICHFSFVLPSGYPPGITEDFAPWAAFWRWTNFIGSLAGITLMAGGIACQGRALSRRIGRSALARVWAALRGR
jgi:hypothetical protein